MLASAHYNTQLGVLAALELDARLTPAQLPWLAALPATSSLLAFELHGGPAVQAVRLVMQDGPAKPYVTIPLLDCARAGSAAEALAGPGACELGAFLKLADRAALPTAAAWCAECDNAVVDACAAARAVSAGFAAAAPAAGGDGAGWKLAVAVVATAAGAGALSAAATAFALRRRRGGGGAAPEAATARALGLGKPEGLSPATEI
jgi:lysosomal acid phosphatase